MNLFLSKQAQETIKDMCLYFECCQNLVSHLALLFFLNTVGALSEVLHYLNPLIERPRNPKLFFITLSDGLSLFHTQIQLRAIRALTTLEATRLDISQSIQCEGPQKPDNTINNLILPSEIISHNLPCYG